MTKDNVLFREVAEGILDVLGVKGGLLDYVFMDEHLVMFYWYRVMVKDPWAYRWVYWIRFKTVNGEIFVCVTYNPGDPGDSNLRECGGGLFDPLFFDRLKEWGKTAVMISK